MLSLFSSNDFDDLFFHYIFWFFLGFLYFPHARAWVKFDGKVSVKRRKKISQSRINIAKPIISKDVLPYFEQIIESGYLRQGPMVKEFEDIFAQRIGLKYAYGHATL